MFIKNHKISKLLAVSSLFFAVILLVSSYSFAAQNPNVAAAGFYQFNALEIFKSPAADEPPVSLEVVQKNSGSCSVYENGKTDKPLPCIFNEGKDNNYIVQIDERTTLLGNNQEPTLLTDFQAGDKINVLGWLSADSKTIRAATMRNLETKDYHQSVSGTVKNTAIDGFTLVLANGDEVFVKTPIAEGVQVTVKGVFDKTNNIISNALSILVKPVITLQEKPAETPETPSTPPVKPSSLFKNFLKIFGL
ncbi:hypothetical protein HY838_00920 [Candidatus Azambacteria bacterium]|nr:hypothetical protein [Candidatus Azambacteria bacterium]